MGRTSVTACMSHMTVAQIYTGSCARLSQAVHAYRHFIIQDRNSSAQGQLFLAIKYLDVSC